MYSPIQSENFSLDIDDIVEETLEEFLVPGAAVGVLVDGQRVLVRGYGARNVDEALPVTEHTVFPIGSCTKAFTSFALGQLVDQGLLSWDDPVQNYLPEFCLGNSSASGDITIRDLVAHRTGLPRHDPIWYCRSMPRSSVLDCLQHLEPAYGLREKWYYNNLLYSVAGIVIEQRTGQSWERAVDSQILSPLQMDHSTCSQEEGEDIALPYAEIDGVVTALPFHHIEAVEPAGGMESSIEDMLLWVQTQLDGGDLIEPATLDDMHSIQIPIEGRNDLGIIQRGYGMGWFLGNYRDHPTISHAGSIDGFASEVVLLPKRNSGIVILTNSSSDGHYAIARIRNAILDRLLQLDHWDEGDEIRRQRTEAKQALQEPTWSRQVFCRDYVGEYEHPAYGIIRVYTEDDRLFAAYGNLLIELHCDHDHSFRGPKDSVFGMNRSWELTFHRGASGDFNEMQISWEPVDQTLSFKRTEKGT